MDKMRASPMVEIPMLNKLKRKRTDSAESPSVRAHDFKKLRPDSVESSLPPLAASPQPLAPSKPALAPAQPVTQTRETVIAAPAPVLDTSKAVPVQEPSSLHTPTLSTASTDLHSSDKTMGASQSTSQVDPQIFATPDVLGFTPLQQVIESEFNMQILMKHNELRLIEQELAKCQIALEQLRRCEIHPYPGSRGMAEAVSTGTGAAVNPPTGYSRPSHPAPYGVTDGPYSRHYKQWLLRDPQFDALPFHMLQPEHSGRPTRNSGSARKSVGQPFSFPGRPAEKMPSLPNYPTAPTKEKNSPNVLRRSDGKFVKLICNDCQRGNFSSIQGFLNHCRIAHKVDYKSHDAAAWDCGRLLDDDELANLPSETQQTPVPKPSVSRTPTVVAPPPPPRSNLVHPLNASTGAAVPHSRPTQATASRKAVPSLSRPAPSGPKAPLTPSAELPRLSAHFAKYNHGGDLAKAASEAKQRIDLFGHEDDLTSPDISEQNSPIAASHAGGASRLSSLGFNNNSRPTTGSKSSRQPSKPRPSPLAPSTNLTTAQEPSRSELPSSPHSHASHTPSSIPDLSPPHRR